MATIIDLYIASFNRASDHDGLTYWLTKMSDDGWSIDEVASSIFDSEEIAALYPPSTTDEDFIDEIYSNLLGRDADEDGMTYWLQEMQNGMTQSQVTLSIIDGVKADTTNPQDQILLENKTEVAQHFTNTLLLNDIPLAYSSMATVTTDPASVVLAKDKQDAFYYDLDSEVTLLEGTEQDDLLTSSIEGIYVYSWAGNDIITTALGADTINAGLGDDDIYSYAGDDTINCREGNDTVYANEGNDTIYGDEGNDSLHGELGDDTIYGNDGDDYLYGDDGDDFLVGNDGADFIYGGIGDDTIYGNDGDDTIQTGTGVDFVDGGAGDDMLYGGSDIDSIYGGKGNDIIYGYEGNDILDGLIGDDTIYGDSGADTINGNDGIDFLYGGAGDDLISGEKGADTIFASQGTDRLSGGEDADTFVFVSEDSNMLTMDTVVDFLYMQDKIQLVNRGTPQIVSNALDVSFATSLSGAVDVAMYGDGSIDPLVKWFIYGDNTYIAQDLSVETTINNTNDIVIKLQGILDLTGLDESTIIF